MSAKRAREATDNTTETKVTVPAVLHDKITSRIANTVILAVDFESLGLYADHFAAGGSLWICGKEVASSFLRAPHTICKEASLPDTNPRNRFKSFIEPNVIPALNTAVPVALGDEGKGMTTVEPNVHTAKELRSGFWSWFRAQVAKVEASGMELIVGADCGAPVEASFFKACVNDFEGDEFDKAQWQGPYPLHELSSMHTQLTYIYGKDEINAAINTHKRLPHEQPAHHPLSDARQTARLIYECLIYAINRK